MKTKIYKTLTLAICLLAFSFTTNAQLPTFTRVDTGAITQWAGGHITSTCFDMDNDGDQDLAVSNSGVYIGRDFSIFKNERNGFYVRVPEFQTSYSENLSSIGDMDNDGDVDLFAGFPSKLLKYYVNDGYGNYQYDTSINLKYQAYYSSVLDINSDGFLDVIGIDRYGSLTYNDGNGGFLPYTDLGLFQVREKVGLHGLSWGDADDDGDLDFYGGYSPQEGGFPKNLCYLNDGNGEFTKLDETSPIVEGLCFTTCANWLDYDNDGDMDLYVNNFGCEGSLSALYENLGDLQFTRHDFMDEIYRYSWANSAVWGDLDNDADLDLYISIENNPFPFTFPWGGEMSATPYNVIYLNEGNGQFTNILDHPLTLEDSHTALLFDHDNDGDLDVLLSRYSWSNDGYDNLFVNEGNDNSWIVLTCEGTISNKSAIGTRIQAKAFVNGQHITQTREITPINGHLAHANLRVHFGLGDADVIDTLIIRWPSGHIDKYLNVKANHFYNAIENDKLEIDFKATNYIEYSPAIPDIEFESKAELITFNLDEHYRLITGDTVPELLADTLDFDSIYVSNEDVVTASINDNILTLESGTENGESEIQVFVDAGFVKRMDRFTVSRVVGINTISVENNLQIFPNPFSTSTTIEYQLEHPSAVTIHIYNHLGELVDLIQQKQQTGEQKIQWNAEGLPAGIYYFRLQAGEQVASGKMVLMK